MSGSLLDMTKSELAPYTVPPWPPHGSAPLVAGITVHQPPKLYPVLLGEALDNTIVVLPPPSSAPVCGLGEGILASALSLLALPALYVMLYVLILLTAMNLSVAL